ncbi:MAG: hypothetical protein DRP09_15180 [Candidatus Thorarchaeota archaeon]|nr:MAG: hypothetical protein DRP09_15180 [Candidatus Thorarchaeota archaeon]
MGWGDWSKISGANLQRIKKACHLNYGAISTGSESRYIHNGTENHFYVSQGMSTWFALVKPSSGTAKTKIGGIFKYYNNNNYIYSYLEIEIDYDGNIVSAKVVYGKVDGGTVVTELEDDVTSELQHLVGMIGNSQITGIDDFEDGTLQGWSGEGQGTMGVDNVGSEGSKSMYIQTTCHSGESKSHRAYKDVSSISWAIIEVLCKRYCDVLWGACVNQVEGHPISENWEYIYVVPTDGVLDVNVECIAFAPEEAYSNSKDYVDTIRYVDYIDIAWAFVKFYGYLKQINGNWYLDIEVRVSNNYYTNPDTSVEPPITKISSYLTEIPSAIVGNNTKCGIILGREVSNFHSQSYPNIIIDYTKLFY